jgi:hypothetical protein
VLVLNETPAVVVLHQGAGLPAPRGLPDGLVPLVLRHALLAAADPPVVQGLILAHCRWTGTLVRYEQTGTERVVRPSHDSG